MPHRLTFLFACILFTSQLHAQYFVAPGTPCPRGGDVNIDTIFYALDKPLPFDRCFYLKLKLPGAANIKYFTINPVDKQGVKKVSKRDYVVYIKSYGPQNKKLMRKFIPYGSFKDPANKVFHIFEGIKAIPDANNTTYILDMPPLDPNREYELILLPDAAADLAEFKKIEDVVLSSSSDSAVNIARMKQADSIFNKVKAVWDADGNLYKDVELEDVIHTVFDCRNKVSLNDTLVKEIDKLRGKRKYFRKSQEFHRKFRFYMVPAGKTIDAAQRRKLKPGSYLDVPASIMNVAAPLALLYRMQQEGILDTDEKPIDFFDTGKYHLYVVTIDSLNIEGRKIGFTAESDTLKLADLTIGNSGSKDSIKLHEFIAKVPQPSCNVAIIKDYDQLEEFKRKLIEVTSEALSCFNAEAMHILMKKVMECPCKEVVKDLAEKNDLTRSIAFFNDLSPAAMKDLRNGIISVKEPFKKLKEPNLAGREANIKVTITQINDLREFIIKVKAVSSASVNEVLDTQLSCMDTLEGQLVNAANMINTTAKLLQKRADYYVSTFSFYKLQKISSGSSELLDFYSAHKLKITPDFGFIGVLKGSDGFGFQDMSPYLGFHINFRSIDKSIPMRSIRSKYWTHYLSFMAGITLRSLKIEGKREDFFGNNCLITGLGGRINNYLRVTGGLVWFRSIDKNPLSTDKPLAFSPFLGLSLDLELQDLFGGIKNLIK